MSKLKQVIVLAGMVVIAALSLYACGGDNPTATPVQPTATTAAAAAPTDTTAPIVAAAPTDTTAPAASAPTSTTASGSGNNGGGNSSDAMSLLQQSSTAMKGVKSFHIVLKTSAAGADTVIEGDVVLPDTARLTITTTGVTEQIIQVGGNSYVQVPGSDSYMQSPSAVSMLGSSTDIGGIASLAQNATVVGDETLDGVDTTHVKFSYDLDQAANQAAQALGTPVTTPSTGMGTADADLWVEKSTGYIHQVVTSSTVAGTATSSTITYTKYNEDVNPPITAPTNIQQIPTIPTVAAP